LITYFAAIDNSRFWTLLTTKNHKLAHLALDIQIFGHVSDLHVFSLELNQKYFRNSSATTHIEKVPLELQKKN